MKEKGRFCKMPLVTTKEMFEKAYNGGYAIGAFNVNNMEIVQGNKDLRHIRQTSERIIPRVKELAEKQGN